MEGALFRTLIPPQEWFDKKYTGDVTPGWTGYLRRKSSSERFISLFIIRIWRHNKPGQLQNNALSACNASLFSHTWLKGSTVKVISKQTVRQIRQAYHGGTWKVSRAMYVSLSHSNSPLFVYWKMEEVMLPIRLDTRCFRSSSGSAFRTAFWKTTLNAWGCAQLIQESVPCQCALLTTSWSKQNPYTFHRCM